MSYPADFKFTKDHEWIQFGAGVGRVGITDYAQQQLGDVVYIDLPDVGTKVKAGQAFGNIESVKAVNELYAPISGEVVEVNTSLKLKPEVVNKEPHTSWMIAIRPSDPGEEASLLNADQYTTLTK
jgi:glycine cleavage system H protein